MFGKAIGNGYAITSIIGRGEIMNNSSKSFISSTFGLKGLVILQAVKHLK